jgi:hypothetical protein
VKPSSGLTQHRAVLFTSGYIDNALLHGDRLGEGVELLNKPYAREELAQKLRKMDGKIHSIAARSDVAIRL